MPTSHRHPIHLPTELVVLVVSFAAADELVRRQQTLYACCLVSRQWYSAAISGLYEKPLLNSGAAFQSFTTTISPPIGARKSKVNLGSLVHRLDLSGLVHHSSPSLTARLLGRIKEHLEVFIAPRVSFSGNSLPALSKCLHLRYLDLSLVGDPVAFPSLKKALSNLPQLASLRLPQSSVLTGDTFRNEHRRSNSNDNNTEPAWPPHLHRLQVSGRFSPHQIPLFIWPSALTSLTLKNCVDLSVENIGSLMSSPQLGQLKRLTISNANRHLHPDSINAIPAFLPSLIFLSVPGDLIEDTFFDMLHHMIPPLALETLEFGYPHLDASLNFSTKALVQTLETGLANLRAVGFSELFCSDQRIQEDEEIDDLLERRAAEQDGASGEFDVGVYYM
ncbi:hypothetical protein FE257_012017 [Aspergillus nanangensis]|uniref:F-box domain-containing protein n=1 Tax=Aspergillus nanangensis TaxID=2582783 RepID=A0AAD4CI83_ASPNN|nr:hypothetical protein FE257_012017 [Aspergillus nanangensis]